MDNIDSMLENANDRAEMLHNMEGAEKAVLVYADKDGNWRRCWFNTSNGDFVYAGAIMQKEITFMFMEEDLENDK